ncbi:hypothetical protein BU15DRAFT_62528 [Melanogaster broomeanus]|nr:hypothetical protein BU15DRAFT_62528 [Melanogaster broomeanus]
MQILCGERQVYKRGQVHITSTTTTKQVIFFPITWRVIGGGVMMGGERHCKYGDDCKLAHETELEADDTTRDSKQVRTGLLAAAKVCQNYHDGYMHRRRNDVPGPCTPPTKRPERPTEPSNPPRRCRRLKTRPTKISRARAYERACTVTLSSFRDQSYSPAASDMDQRCRGSIPDTYQSNAAADEREPLAPQGPISEICKTRHNLPNRAITQA